MASLPFAGGAPIEVYEPVGNRRWPLVLMLHGTAGVFSKVEGAEQRTSDNFGERAIARACFVVVLPHYFEAVHVRSLTSKEEIVQHSPDLQAAIVESLNVALKLDSVDSHKVAVYGESLGGFFAVHLASSDPRVKVVSVFGAGEPPAFRVENHSWRALLIQHGTADDIVPFVEATRLAEDCRKAGVETKVQIYPGEGHYFSETSRELILQRTIDFLHKNLDGKAIP